MDATEYSIAHRFRMLITDITRFIYRTHNWEVIQKKILFRARIRTTRILYRSTLKQNILPI